MLSMYAKCSAKCRRGMHFASILPRRPSFSVRIPQIMHSGQILPLLFDLSFVRELCDSCLRGSSGRDQHRGSTFTGIFACLLREGANAAARPLCGGVNVVVHPLREGSSVVAHPPLGRWRCGLSSTWKYQRRDLSSTWRCKRRCPLLAKLALISAPSTWRHQRCASSFMRECQRGKKKIARRRKAPSLARPSRSAFLSGKSWQYFVAMHSRRGASVRQRKATGRETPSRIRHRLRGR